MTATPRDLPVCTETRHITACLMTIHLPSPLQRSGVSDFIVLLERTGTPAHLNTVACLTVLPTVAVPATAVTGSVGIDVLVPTTFSAVTVKEY